MFADELDRIDAAMAVDSKFARAKRTPAPFRAAELSRVSLAERAFANPASGRKSAVAAFDKDGRLWWQQGPRYARYSKR
jgi:hypothetical protein